MQGYVYILKCADGNYYVGSTNDLRKRISEHQQGKSRATKSRRPVRLVYYKSFKTLREAREAERFIKRQRNKQFYKKLIEGKFHF